MNTNRTNFSGKQPVENKGALCCNEAWSFEWCEMNTPGIAVQYVESPLGGKICVHRSVISLHESTSLSYRGYQLSSGPVYNFYLGAVFLDGRCLAVTEASSNAATAVLLAKKIVDRGLDLESEVGLARIIHEAIPIEHH